MRHRVGHVRGDFVCSCVRHFVGHLRGLHSRCVSTCSLRVRPAPGCACSRGVPGSEVSFLTWCALWHLFGKWSGHGWDCSLALYPPPSPFACARAPVCPVRRACVAYAGAGPRVRRFCAWLLHAFGLPRAHGACCFLRASGGACWCARWRVHWVHTCQDQLCLMLVCCTQWLLWQPRLPNHVVHVPVATKCIGALICVML